MSWTAAARDDPTIRLPTTVQDLHGANENRERPVGQASNAVIVNELVILLVNSSAKFEEYMDKQYGVEGQHNLHTVLDVVHDEVHDDQENKPLGGGP